ALALLACLPTLADDVPGWQPIYDAGGERFPLDTILLSFARELYEELPRGPAMDPAAPPPPPFDAARYRRMMNDLAIRAQAAIAGIVSPAERVEAFNRFFFVDEGFICEPTSAAGDPDLYRLDRVLENRRGDAVGLALLYAATCEKLSTGIAGPLGERERPLPAFPVRVPGHLFVRVVFPTWRRNVEAARRGASLENIEYVRHHDIPQDQVDREIYLAELSKDQVIGLLSALRADIYYGRGEWANAVVGYGAALKKDRRLVEVYLRRAVAAFRGGSLELALEDVSRALNLVPDFPEAYRVRGRIHYDRFFDPQLGFPPSERASGPARETLAAAERDLSAAIALAPGLAGPYRLRARVRGMLGDDQGGGADLVAFIERTREEGERRAAEADLADVRSARSMRVVVDRTAPYGERIRAAMALGELRSMASVPALLHALDDPNVRFRWQVVQALVHITGRDMGAQAHPWRQWWETREGGPRLPFLPLDLATPR
ncbi:MAG: HEAT repeat domain-containing protein, partial [Planctomycetes bacterium]|nr:HEAT repeat domain-containing protein [Planctomycetota bacterium]